MASVIGKNITDIRLRLNETKVQFSKRTGISISHLKNVENSDTSLSTDKLLQLTRTLKIPIDFFLPYASRKEMELSLLAMIDIVFKPKSKGELIASKNIIDAYLKSYEK